MHRTLPTPPAVGTGGTGFTTDTTGCTGLTAVTAYDWTLPAYLGGTFTIKICYADIYYGEQTCLKEGSTVTCGVNLQKTALIDSIVLPNSTAWTFTYDSANPNVTGSTGTGNLLQITFPTGGYIQYSWTGIYVCQTDLDTGSTTYTYAVASRTVNANDGKGNHTWKYAFGNVPLNTTTYTSTSTDPLGEKTVHTISAEAGLCAFYETKSQTYTAAGSLLKTVATVFNAAGDPMTLTGLITTAANVVPTSVTTTWANNQVSEVATTYDAGVAMTAPVSGFKLLYGNPVTKQEYDFGSGTHGSLLRTTTTAYQAFNSSSYLANNLLALPASVTITGGSQSGITDYGYDETAAVSSGVTTQHDSSPPDGTIRGNQTSVSRYLNTSTVQTAGCPVTISNGYVKTKFSIYDTGETYQTTDPCLNLTTFSYSGSFDGAYLTQTTLPATGGVQHITSTNYDFDSGLVTSTTDQNGNVTSFTYDVLWRLASVTYPSPNGGQATISRQESVTPFYATLTRSITSSLNYVQTDTYDGLGRVSNTQISSDPDGPVNVTTTYDSRGLVESVTNPYRQVGESTYGTTSYVYDALDRVCVLVPPDGTAVPSDVCPSARPANDVFTTYSGGTTTVTDESGKARESVADGLGRLTRVFEDPSGLDYETDYQYDVLNNLLNVSQKGGSTSSTNWRPRTFVYDSLSQLSSATNPESGVITYAYDADGNLVTKTSPAQNQTGSATVTLSYCYDPLNRVTSKAYTSQTCPMTSPAATYSYDQGSPTANPIGRRTGMVDAPGSESWTYDVMGRVATDQRTTNGVAETFTYTYTNDGSVATIVYPTSSPETMTYAPGGAGRPLEVTSPVEQYLTVAHYAPDGSPCSLTASGSSIFLTDLFNTRFQPLRVVGSTAAVAPPTPCGTPTRTADILDLTYAMNFGAGDNGNVISITNNLDTTRSQNFSYDSLNRISSAQTRPRPARIVGRHVRL